MAEGAGVGAAVSAPIETHPRLCYNVRSGLQQR